MFRASRARPFPGAVENDEGWATNRVTPGKVILGNLDGIEVGVRQMIRKRQLEVAGVGRPSRVRRAVVGAKRELVEELAHGVPKVLARPDARRDAGEGLGQPLGRRWQGPLRPFSAWRIEGIFEAKSHKTSSFDQAQRRRPDVHDRKEPLLRLAAAGRDAIEHEASERSAAIRETVGVSEHRSTRTLPVDWRSYAPRSGKLGLTTE